jgi:hypothetical protein
MQLQNVGEKFELPELEKRKIRDAVEEMNSEQFKARLAERTQYLRRLNHSVASVNAQVEFLKSLCPHWNVEPKAEGNFCYDCEEYVGYDCKHDHFMAPSKGNSGGEAIMTLYQL